MKKDATSKAFLSSNGGKEFAGKKLAPFTPQRMAIAAEMGLKWSFVGRYKSQFFFRDTIIVIWLCSPVPVRKEDDGRSHIDVAEGDPEAAMQRAFEWARENGVMLGSAQFQSAFEQFLAITAEIRESRGKPIPKNPGDTIDGPGDDPGE